MATNSTGPFLRFHIRDAWTTAVSDLAELTTTVAEAVRRAQFVPAPWWATSGRAGKRAEEAGGHAPRPICVLERHRHCAGLKGRDSHGSRPLWADVVGFTGPQHLRDIGEPGLRARLNRGTVPKAKITRSAKEN